jgi:hypothetical protein
MHRRKALRTCLVAWGASLCLAPSGSLAQEPPSRATHEFAKIDTRPADEAIAALTGGNADLRQQTVLRIKEQPEKYAPTVFYVLSNVLLEQGEKDDAAFWFYAGQLRARFDANRCADASARQAVTALNLRFGQGVNQHAFQDIPKLEALIPRVVEWDRKTPHRYDHRWINLHGLDAIVASEGGTSTGPAVLSLPAEEWEKIAEKTREDYLDGFRRAMSQVKSRK